MKVFLSYYSGEESDAEDIRDHLISTFRDKKMEVFMASSWDSLTPGEPWESKLIEAIESATAQIVLMSVDALSRPWLNFEIGVAWAKKTRILVFCHKGLTPAALPRPYSSLQAVDLNALRAEERLSAVAKALGTALNISIAPTPLTMPVTTSFEPGTFTSMYRTWSLRPTAHIDETAIGEFLVGPVYPSRADRTKAASLKPGEALYIRLFLGATPESAYVPVMVAGEHAEFFERVKRDTVRIKATLQLAASFEEEDRTVPLIILKSYEVL